MTYQRPTNGTFRPSQEDAEQFPLRGDIVLRTFQARSVALQTIPNRTNEDAPTHDVVEYVGGRLIRLGAAWSKTDKNGRTFYSVTLNSEELPQTVYFNLFESQDEPGSYDVIVSRPRVKKDTEESQ